MIIDITLSNTIQIVSDNVDRAVQSAGRPLRVHHHLETFGEGDNTKAELHLQDTRCLPECPRPEKCGGEGTLGIDGHTSELSSSYTHFVRFLKSGNQLIN